MSNTSKGKGIKGSKFWIQTVINSDLRDELNKELGEEILWLSPIAQNNYSEYKLNDEYITKQIGISKELYSFWPQNQPQWDAIGINKDRNVLYLVEAKAHTNELKSKLTATSETSIEKIIDVMRQVYQQKYAEGDFDSWINRYYQLGNRLTFLSNLNDISGVTGLKVKLVLLNFVNDITFKPTLLEKWEKHYREVFETMTGKEKIPEDVVVINFSVRNKE